MGLLNVGAGAAKGLQEMMQDEIVRQEQARRQQATDADIAHTKVTEGQSDRNYGLAERGVKVAEGNARRSDTSADITNQGAQLKLDLLRKITDGGGSALPGTPEPVGIPGQESVMPQGAGAGGFHKIGEMDNPSGRAQLEIAGLHPNDMFGSVRQPKGPEDLNSEEVFYTGKAKKAGFADYKSWGAADPQGMASARREWATESHFVSPSMSSEPMVQVEDPDNPGQTIYQPRSQAAGMHGPRPAGQKDKVTAYNDALDLVDEISSLGEKTGWGGVGPISGPVGSLGKRYLGVGSDDAEKLRTKIAKLKAVASFAEGGKQFTGTEQKLVEDFLAGYASNPAQVKDRLAEFKNSAERSLAAMNAKRDTRIAQPTGPGSTPAPGPGGAGDAYSEYLKRHGGGGTE